jgi:endonuclease/exonuclease/phosphatase (EEP) superfamily protein YafD
MLALLLGGLAALLLAASLIGRLPVHWWWIRVCEFPRLQLSAAALAVVLLALLLSPPERWWVVGAGLATLAIQIPRILPWTPLWPHQVQDAESGPSSDCLTLLVANVLTPNRQAAGLVAMIHRHDPDLVLTLESDAWWQARLDESLARDWPHAVRVPQDNLYGMHLYSRLPLVEPRVERLIQDDIPSIHTGVELDSGERVGLCALHPRPPAPGESEESLWRDAELLLVGKAIHDAPAPTIVAGDLNDVAWSRTTRQFCRISGMLDPRRGRGLYSTFHARYPLLRWPLDHVFVSEHFTLAHLERLPGFGSDHFPILVRLRYRPSRSDENEPPEADHAEHRDAGETISEAQRRDQQTPAD